MNTDDKRAELEERDLKIIDFDLAYMAENYEQARQHENLRAQMASIALGLSGVVFAAAFTFPTPLVLMLFGLFIILLGSFGRRFSLKHYERFKFHVAVARIARYGICQRLGCDLNYRTIAKNSRLQEFKKEKPFDPRVRPYNKDLYAAYQKDLYEFWLSLHRGQYVLGAVMAAAGVVWWFLSEDLLSKGGW